MSKAEPRWSGRSWHVFGACFLTLCAWFAGAREKNAAPDVARDYSEQVQPLVKKYCLSCHNQKIKKGDLDLERFGSIDLARKDVHAWQLVLEMLENGEMPPKKALQPHPEERMRFLAWVRPFLTAEARAHAGDPGRVVVRRLSNAEYNNTIRDLTGVDLQPANTFPVDGAAGEGFTNAGDALATSPTLLNKYLSAGKEAAAHAVLLPDGFRFSPSKTRRDWTDEVLADLHGFYGEFTGRDGRLPLARYLTATIRYRDEIAAGKISLPAVATREKLNRKYLDYLWQVLNRKDAPFPLDQVHDRWRRAKVQDAGAILGEIAEYQAALWKIVPIGSYRYGNLIRQVANNPSVAVAQTVRLKIKPEPGQTEVVLYLTGRDLSPTKAGTLGIWQRPRFEGANKPVLLLRDLDRFADQFTLNYATVFAATSRYLAATVEAANNRKLPLAELAQKHRVDAGWLPRWIDLLAVEPIVKETADSNPFWAREPAIALQLLSRKSPATADRPKITGWRDEAADLPIAVSNASDQTENIPGTVRPHTVAVHPTPTHFSAIVWSSPVDGTVRLGTKITHAHPACGNGIEWWLEQRRAERSAILDKGIVERGQGAEPKGREIRVAKGDQVVLAIGARNLDHTCDLTAVEMTITETARDGRSWDLARDVADTVGNGNPHADRFGNPDVWRFAKGLDPATRGRPITGIGAKGPKFEAVIPSQSVLGKWRTAAGAPHKQQDLERLARQVSDLLTGPRPKQQKHPDRVLFDNLVTLGGPLFKVTELSKLPGAQRQENGESRPGASFGLDRARFGRHPLGERIDDASLVIPVTSVQEVRLPAALFLEREFVVETRLDAAGAESAVQFQASYTSPGPNPTINLKAPFVGKPDSNVVRRFIRGLDAFRMVFPLFISHAQVIPDDEVVCLKLYHREDEPLVRLFLDDTQARRLDRLWSQLRFISRSPVTENDQLPQFIGYVTQDQPKELLAYFEGQRGAFRKRAQEFEKEEEAAVGKQLDALLDFAARAYRRPLQETEKTELLQLYQKLREKKMVHEEAFRTVLTRILVSPSFLFRLEKAVAGSEAQLVSSWELATRLSYSLWATMPDESLRQAAAEGRLLKPEELSAQVRRMLKDPKVRGLASEFGTQWLHVRDIIHNREKNEKLFPTFNDGLREAFFEETVLLFQDLFQNDRPVCEVLDADRTFLNDTLARHYGIPGVNGPQWRRVDGVKTYGRGGILTLASVLTKQSGASRTSPVLRGNWLVEVLLGEKLPKPPPGVPQLPEQETGGEGLTVRQMVEKHARVASCAVCHVRIDPFGFALERYDPIGRARDKDLGGRAIDVKVKLKDGTAFEGVEGLRTYLLTQRKEDFQRHFCQKLLGYFLGRSVTLSDQVLLDEIMDRLKKNDSMESVVIMIALSKQFRYHRGLEATKSE